MDKINNFSSSSSWSVHSLCLWCVHSLVFMFLCVSASTHLPWCMCREENFKCWPLPSTLFVMGSLLFTAIVYTRLAALELRGGLGVLSAPLVSSWSWDYVCILPHWTWIMGIWTFNICEASSLPSVFLAQRIVRITSNQPLPISQLGHR